MTIVFGGASSPPAPPAVAPAGPTFLQDTIFGLDPELAIGLIGLFGAILGAVLGGVIAAGATFRVARWQAQEERRRVREDAARVDLIALNSLLWRVSSAGWPLDVRKDLVHQFFPAAFSTASRLREADLPITADLILELLGQLPPSEVFEAMDDSGGEQLPNLRLMTFLTNGVLAHWAVFEEVGMNLRVLQIVAKRVGNGPMPPRILREGDVEGGSATG